MSLKLKHMIAEEILAILGDESRSYLSFSSCIFLFYEIIFYIFKN